MYALQVSPCFSAIIFLSILTGHYRSKRCTQILVADASCNNPSSSYRGESSCKWYLIYFSLLLTSYIIRRGTFLGAKRMILNQSFRKLSRHKKPPKKHKIAQSSRRSICILRNGLLQKHLFPIPICFFERQRLNGLLQQIR